MAISVKAPAGSHIFRHGDLRHDALPEKTAGLRLNPTTRICDKRLKPHENFRPNPTQETIARNPPEFARRAGAGVAMGPRCDRVRQCGMPNSALAKRLRKKGAALASA